jgi:hypothetical protein
LEELDLSNNLLSGPPPLSFEKLKTSLLKLNLKYNNFAGDYTRLADLERNSNTKFLRTDGLSLGVEIQPQRPCPLDTYAKAHEGAHDDLPSCEVVPVRLKRCLPRSDATRHNLTSLLVTWQATVAVTWQATVAVLRLQADRLSVRVRKPTAPGTGEGIGIALIATGGARSEALFGISMCRNCRPEVGDSSAVTSSRLWARADEKSVSLDGVHVEWGTPPSTDAMIDLNASAARFSFRKHYEFNISLGCTNKSQQSCVADGDTVVTVVQLAGPSSSAVTVVTTVEALASCVGSSASLVTPPGDVQPTTMGVHFVVTLIDVDGLPIQSSTPKATAFWGSSSKILEKMAPGTNSLEWEVPSTLRSQPGSYTYRVELEEGWDEAQGLQTRCALTQGTLVIAKEALKCDRGFVSVWHGQEVQCESCYPGMYSQGGAATACKACAPGHFQPGSAASTCISCDNLGNYYQENSSGTTCTPCPTNTQRFIGVLSGASIGACQCKEGTASVYANWNAHRRSVHFLDGRSICRLL